MNFSKKDYLVLFLYIAFVAIQFYGIDALHLPENTMQTVRLAIIFLNAFIVLYAYKDVLSADWKIFKQHSWTKWVIIIATFALIVCLINLIRSFTGNHGEETEALSAVVEPEEANDIKDLSLYAFILTLITLLIPLLSSITEEIMFRYVCMFKHSRSTILQYILLLLSSIMFGVIHYQVQGSIEATIPYIFVGLILGALYLWKKNIWYNIFTHMMFNGINVLLAFLGILYQRFL